MNILFLDIESTGLSYKVRDRILEYGSVLYDPLNKVIDSELGFLVNPNMFIPNKVSEIHGIYNNHVNGLSDFASHSEKIVNEMCKVKYIAGHNIDRFDIPFICQELIRSGVDIPKDFYIVDTYLLAKKFIKDPLCKSFSLDNLCIYYNIDLSSRTKHSAIIDCRLTVELFKRLNEDYDLTSSLIHVDEKYIESKNLNYDIAKPPKELVVPKYLDLANDDYLKIKDYVKKEKAKLPWINKYIKFDGFNLNNAICPYEDSKYVPIISLINKYEVISQQILIDFFINLKLLNQQFLPTSYGVENNMVKFKVKPSNGRDIIYIVFNKDYVSNYFSENTQELKSLKLKSVNYVKDLIIKG